MSEEGTIKTNPRLRFEAIRAAREQARLHNEIGYGDRMKREDVTELANRVLMKSYGIEPITEKQIYWKIDRRNGICDEPKCPSRARGKKKQQPMDLRLQALIFLCGLAIAAVLAIIVYSVFSPVSR